jgi:hypothetical protein
MEQAGESTMVHKRYIVDLTARRFNSEVQHRGIDDMAERFRKWKAGSRASVTAGDAAQPHP